MADRTIADDRVSILARVREALKLSAPRPGERHQTHSPGVPLQVLSNAPRTDAFAQWLPRVGPALSDWQTLFATNSIDLRTEFFVVPTMEAARAALEKLKADNAWSRIATHRTTLTDTFCQDIGLPTLLTDDPFTAKDMAMCDAGISACDALIAQTGSVLLTSVSAGGRALSVLPPHHVVIATKDQLVPDLPGAFQLLQTRYAGRFPSFMTFITGPSRTGDIERILVLGAHGPKRLTVILLDAVN